jgi:carbon storage regulator
MLVLSRRKGETVVIDGDIQITVVAVQGDRVRLGITAPKDTLVDRQEVHERRSEFSNGFSRLRQMSNPVESEPW